MLNLDFDGRVFEDNFLIADIKMKHPRAAERRFWFDPPLAAASALLHKQADDIWRCDFQLGAGIDKKAAVAPENVAPLVRGLLGEAVDFSFEWLSVYTFHCRRMARFVHDRFIFLGDAAHLVSPFGARGGNGGIADAENLGWKLHAILRGEAGADLLESYHAEAGVMADENIRHSTRTSDFITPKNAASRAFRDGVLALAGRQEFARAFVNSGAAIDAGGVPAIAIERNRQRCVSRRYRALGSVCADAPITTAAGDGWLLSEVGGRFVALVFGDADLPAVDGVTTLNVLPPDASPQAGCVIDSVGVVAERFGAADGDVYLIRPRPICRRSVA